MGKIIFSNNDFCRLKNALKEFQRAMDQVLVGLVCAKCYIDDIITFSLTSKDHKHHL
jgi:hypothetical protein